MALEFARQGADVVICGTNPEKLEQVKQELINLGVRADAYVCDVADPVQAEATVKRAAEFLGSIDILANIAGISPKKEGGFKAVSYTHLPKMRVRRARQPAKRRRPRKWLLPAIPTGLILRARAR